MYNLIKYINGVPCSLLRGESFDDVFTNMIAFAAAAAKDRKTFVIMTEEFRVVSIEPHQALRLQETGGICISAHEYFILMDNKLDESGGHMSFSNAFEAACRTLYREEIMKKPTKEKAPIAYVYYEDRTLITLYRDGICKLLLQEGYAEVL